MAAINRPHLDAIATRRIFMRTSAAALLPLSMLSACGGGDSDPPSITLYSTISSGKEGAVFSLNAEADDDDGISEVSFYRVTNNSEILLATFSARPYLLQTEIPTGTAGTTIEYMARATDSDDQTTDSTRVSITVNT